MKKASRKYKGAKHDNIKENSHGKEYDADSTVRAIWNKSSDVAGF